MYWVCCVCDCVLGVLCVCDCVLYTVVVLLFLYMLPVHVYTTCVPVFVSLGSAAALNLGNEPRLLMMHYLASLVVFYCAHWETFVSGTMKFGKWVSTTACYMFVCGVLRTPTNVCRRCATHAYQCYTCLVMLHMPNNVTRLAMRHMPFNATHVY